MSNCPRCDTTLENTEYLSQPVAACGRCGGRWMTADTLGAVVEAWDPGAEEALEDRGGCQVPLADVREGLRCPDCRAAMEAFNYAGDSGVILDRCPRCGGLWLDRGELEQVLRVAAASRRGLERDAKRFSADLHREEVRQDALEQQDARNSPFPGGTAAASPFLGGAEGP
jgi:Zn-finger nucleic acid-binding protein